MHLVAVEDGVHRYIVKRRDTVSLTFYVTFKFSDTFVGFVSLYSL